MTCEPTISSRSPLWSHEPGYPPWCLNQATQHWHTGSTRKHAISACPWHRVYESRVDRFRAQTPSQGPAMDDPQVMRAYNCLRTKHFHGALSGNQHLYLLKSRYGKVSRALWGAGNCPRALSVSASRVRLGQDRLSGMLEARTGRVSEWHPIPERIVSQAKICYFYRIGGLKQHNTWKYRVWGFPRVSFKDRLWDTCGPP